MIISAAFLVVFAIIGVGVAIVIHLSSIDDKLTGIGRELYNLNKTMEGVE